MPIKSYLAIPSEGQKDDLQQDISKLLECEVIPSENKDVLVVLTETVNDEEEKKLFKKLRIIWLILLYQRNQFHKLFFRILNRRPHLL